MFKKYLLFSIAFVTLSIAVGNVSYALTHDEVARWVTVVALGCLAVGLLCLGVQVRSDADSVLIFLSVFLLLLALVEGIYLYSAHDPGWLPKLLLGASALGAVGLGALTYRRQFGADSSVYPNVLRAHFQEGSILEMDGVQFTGFVEPATPGHPHWISLLVQNCYDAPRHVRIRFDAERDRKHLRYHHVFNTRLGAAEVRRFHFPVIAPTVPGEYDLYFNVSVEGTGGTRVRLWRAKTPSSRVRGDATVALLAVGVFAHGGGLKFTLGPLAEDFEGAVLPAPRNQIVWPSDGGP
jgi:hypothetical protein